MKMYTAQEMRDMAEQILIADDDWYEEAGYMLRQAADMMDMAERVIADRDNWRRQALDEDARANASTTKESLTVGNAAAMRKALEQIHELLGIGGKPDAAMCIRYEAAYQIAEEALSASPRNCDLLSDAQKALSAIHEDRVYVNNPVDERRLTVNWLFAESKGEVK